MRAAHEVGSIELDGSLSLRMETALRLPRRCDLDFDEALIGEGWHGCEREGDVPFRWMGVSKSATVVLVLDRSIDCVAALRIYACRTARIMESISIAADDQSRIVPLRRGSNELSFVLPRREAGAGVTRIFIQSEEGVVTLPDPRPLSIAFSSLRVRPQDDAQNGGDAQRLVLVAKLSQYLKNLSVLAPLTTRADGDGDAA